MKRVEQSSFVDSLEISQRGLIKTAASQVPGRIGTTKTDVEQTFKVTKPDLPINTQMQYKKVLPSLTTDSKTNKQMQESIVSDWVKEKKRKQRTQVASIAIVEAKTLRQQGIFKIAGRGVYEDLETGDFWKISDDKKSVIRLFKEDEKGISDKRAAVYEQSIQEILKAASEI